MSGGTGISFNIWATGTVSIAPGTISSNTSSEVSVTINGVQSGDLVFALIKPTLTAGIDLGNFRVSAANTVRATYQNSTGSPVAVPTETYSFAIMRPEFAPGSADATSIGVAIFR